MNRPILKIVQTKVRGIVRDSSTNEVRAIQTSNSQSVNALLRFGVIAQIAPDTVIDGGLIF